MKTLVTRTITGVFFVAALVGCVVWSEMSFALFFALIAGLGVWEFSANVNRHAGAAVNPFIASTAAVVLVLTVGRCSSMQVNYALFLPFVGTLLYLLISELYRKAENPLKNWAYAFAAQLYVALPLSMISLLAYHLDVENGLVVFDWFYPSPCSSSCGAATAEPISLVQPLVAISLLNCFLAFPLENLG